MSPDSTDAVTGPIRHLIIVLGDQLNIDASAFDGADPRQDLIWLCEASDEAKHVPSSPQRTALFLSAMRHFSQELREQGWRVVHRRGFPGRLNEALVDSIQAWRKQGWTPRALVITEAGEWRLRQAFAEAAQQLQLPWDVRPDRHFLCPQSVFVEHARGRRQLRMEFFYREMRRRENVLMADGQPVGGQWNFDADNRASFGHEGPGFLPARPRFEPDAITREVIREVQQAHAGRDGQIWPGVQAVWSVTEKDFGWPVTRAQALAALDDFIAHRLPSFGLFQDAMWDDEPWLYHAALSSSLNLKLLSPREVIAAAEAAWQRGQAPLAAVEGFIRQILGWREYVRGVYDLLMPAYAERNTLQAELPLPDFYWTGQTEMRCLSQAIGQTLRLGYAHHIQRLMVTGLYALLLGVNPQALHRWYLGVYVDAVEWVELPNTLGMSQYADGGVMASKPYVATGQYIARMGNHCRGCRFDPTQRIGSRACPFTTLYWDFLDRHQAQLASHPRMALQVKNLQRMAPSEWVEIRAQAQRLKEGRYMLS